VGGCRSLAFAERKPTCPTATIKPRKKIAADTIVRITSDCPLIDPELIDTTIRAFLNQKADYATNSLVVTYPRGLDVEVMTARRWARHGAKRERIISVFR